MRMDFAEAEIKRLSKASGLDRKSVSTLKGLLPEFVACKKDKYGNIIIPDDFWHAITDRLKKEDVLIEREIRSGSQETIGISRKDVSTIAQNLIDNSEGVWKRFLDNNKERVQNLQKTGDKDLQLQISGAVKEFTDQYRQADKDEFIEAIKRNWDDTQSEVQKHLTPVTKKVEDYLRSVKQSQRNGITSKEAIEIATEVAEKTIRNAKLSALSNANTGIQADAGLLRINHFSPGTGAAINKALVSPNYLFPTMNRPLAEKFGRWLFGQSNSSPQPPIVALKDWKEHGDCWCSPSKDENGFGPSLAVLIDQRVQPDQVIVEHITSSAALEPGAAPKDMELLAFVEDIPTYHKLKMASEKVFSDEIIGSEKLTGYVRLGVWQYDASVDRREVQSFPLQIDLKEYGPAAFTKSVIVRAKNNWGGDKVEYTCLYRVRLNGDILR